jgi:hypothetical protein
MAQRATHFSYFAGVLFQRPDAEVARQQVPSVEPAVLDYDGFQSQFSGSQGLVPPKPWRMQD